MTVLHAPSTPPLIYSVLHFSSLRLDKDRKPCPLPGGTLQNSHIYGVSLLLPRGKPKERFVFLIESESLRTRRRLLLHWEAHSSLAERGFTLSQ